MKGPILALAGVLASVACARADEVVDGAAGVRYHKVTVVGVEDGKLVFTFFGQRIRRPLDGITRISLDDSAAFTGAERLRAEGKPEQAAGAYRKALSAAEKAGLKKLIRARMEGVIAGDGEAGPAKEPGGQLSPRPTSSPGPKRGIRKDKPEALSSVAAFAQAVRSLGPRPVDPENDAERWARLTALERLKARKGYRDKLEQWEARRRKAMAPLRGRQVEWVLRLAEVPKGGPERGREVTARAAGVVVTAPLQGVDQGASAKLGRGDAVRVEGTFVEYRFGGKGGASTPEAKPLIRVRLRDATVRAVEVGGVAVFFGAAGGADEVVFLVDRSGSMLDKLASVKAELLRSVSKLGPRQRFGIVLLSSDGVQAYPPKGLAAAGAKQKRRAAAFLRTVIPQGQTEVIPALNSAFKALKRAGDDRGEVLFLLTDGAFPDNAKVLAALKKLNRGRRTIVCTLLFGQKVPEAVKVLKQIARQNGGTYRCVSAEGD